MRVLFVQSPADLYGASRSLLRLCADLRKDDVEVCVIVDGPGPLLEGLAAIGVEVIIHPGLVRIERQSLSGWRAKTCLVPAFIADAAYQFAVIRRWRPDVVHTNNAIMPATGLVTALLGRRHLWHIRENFSEFPKLWPIYRHVMAWFSTVIIANSRLTARQFDGIGRGECIRVVHNGLPMDEFCAVDPADVEAWRQRFSPEGGPVVGVVGRIKLIRKGQDVFLDAAARLADQFPAARFVCIGGPYPGNEAHAAELNQRAEAAGIADRFMITGDIQNVAAATAALDIALMPSVIPEPFGNVVMEAMALGKPVIASDNGGAAEQIVDQVTGFLVPPGDAIRLSAAIATLLSNPVLARTMGEAGRQRAMDHFSAERTYADIRRIYDETAPHRSPLRARPSGQRKGHVA